MDTKQIIKDRISSAFSQTKKITVSFAVTDILCLAITEKDGRISVNKKIAELVKKYGHFMTISQVRKEAGIKNSRGAGRKPPAHPQTFLRIAATSEEIKAIQKLTPRKRAEILLMHVTNN